jgi:hypothetical protein
MSGRTTLPNNAEVVPGIVAGIYWPKVRNGCWTDQNDILLRIPKDKGVDWMFAVAAGRDNPLPAAEIMAACQAWPEGWTEVKRAGGAYPTSKDEEEIEGVPV